LPRWNAAPLVLKTRQPKPRGEPLQVVETPERITRGKNPNAKPWIDGEQPGGRRTRALEIAAERQRRRQRAIARREPWVQPMRLAQPAERLIVASGHELGDSRHRVEEEVHWIKGAQSPRVAKTLERFVRFSKKAVGRATHPPGKRAVFVQAQRAV